MAVTVMKALVAAFALSLMGGASCSKGVCRSDFKWKYYESSETCLLWQKDYEHFPEAVKFCRENFKSRLVEINDQSLNEDVKDDHETKGSSVNVWIGNKITSPWANWAQGQGPMTENVQGKAVVFSSNGWRVERESGWAFYICQSDPIVGLHCPALQEGSDGYTATLDVRLENPSRVDWIVRDGSTETRIRCSLPNRTCQRSTGNYRIKATLTKNNDKYQSTITLPEITKELNLTATVVKWSWGQNDWEYLVTKCNGPEYEPTCEHSVRDNTVTITCTALMLDANAKCRWWRDSEHIKRETHKEVSFKKMDSTKLGNGHYRAKCELTDKSRELTDGKDYVYEVAMKPESEAKFTDPSVKKRRIPVTFSDTVTTKPSTKTTGGGQRPTTASSSTTTASSVSSPSKISGPNPVPPSSSHSEFDLAIIISSSILGFLLFIVIIANIVILVLTHLEFTPEGSWSYRHMPRSWRLKLRGPPKE